MNSSKSVDGKAGSRGRMVKMSCVDRSGLELELVLIAGCGLGCGAERIEAVTARVAVARGLQVIEEGQVEAG